ncbi:MAG: hypothetical protein LBV00_04010 [Propionibacteriaceae bacterium]|jgi:hypothetical protein|nr:hypothetical protein [Propionibacteriaceae bacterium]
MLSSLADGADRLCARVALDMGCRLRVPLPMARADYERDFGEESRREFDYLLSQAEDAFVVGSLEPTPNQPRRGYFYRQAGLYVARQSHLLIALWDGVEVLYPEGGGTYETVRFTCREGGIVHCISTPRSSDMATSCHADVGADAGSPVSGVPLGNALGGATEAGCEPALVMNAAPEETAARAGAPSGPAQSIRDSRLETIEEFNRDIARHKPTLDPMIEQGKVNVVDASMAESLSADSSAILTLFLCADALSILNRDLKLRALRVLSLLGLLLVLSFLLYDEMESDLMLLAYGAIVLAAFAVYRFSSQRRYHQKYCRYRALAEALRVRLYWGLSGIYTPIHQSYTYAQGPELDFVRFVMLAGQTQVQGCGRPEGSAVTASSAMVAPHGPLFGRPIPSVAPPSVAPAGVAPAGVAPPAVAPPDMTSDRAAVVRLWIGGQYDYHCSSAAKKGRQDHRNATAARLLFLLSLLLFIVVVVMEAFFKVAAQGVVPVGSTLQDILMMHDGQHLIWRGVLKIALGVLAAATAFLANYYGSLALPQQIFNDQRMRTLFADALRADPLDLTVPRADSLRDDATHERVLRLVGRESLIESAAWYLTQRENEQKLFI